MAKNRMINTRFWQDAYASNLDPVEKLLFLYLLTNNYSTLCGVYEMPIKVVAVETGLDKEMVEKILTRFQDSDKVIYRDGWVAIKNFIKHHEQGSPKVKLGIEKDLENSPEWAKEYVLGKGMDTLSPSASASASASASHDIGDTPAKEARSFFSKTDAYHKILETMALKNDRTALEREFEKFILYWTEKNKSGTKQRWEQQSTFEVKRRLYTWLGRVRPEYKKQGKEIIGLTV